MCKKTENVDIWKYSNSFLIEKYLSKIAFPTPADSEQICDN